MNEKRLLAVALAGLMLLSSVSAASAVSSAAANTAANDSLVVAVENAGNEGATVSVTHNDTAVTNASVTVEAENSTYAGVGEYTTGEDGEVSLPEPAANVTVQITAAKDNLTGSTTTTIYATEADGEGSFGDLVSSFVHEMLNAGDDGGPIGQVISDFVTENNPGNASEKRPDDAGKSDDKGKANGKDKGNSENAGPNNETDEGDDSQGPPENAGNDEDDSDGSSGSESDGGNNDGNGKDDGSDKKGNGKGKGK